MKRRYVLTFVLLVVIFLTACGVGQPTTVEEEIYTPTREDLEEMIESAVAVEVESQGTELEPEKEEAKAEENEDLEIVPYTFQSGAVPLGDVKLLGVSYFPNQDVSMTFDFPFQSHVVVTVGNAKVNGEGYSAAPDEINLIYDLCRDEDGCSIEVDGYKAGHISLTIMFPGSEKPRSTATGALARSWLAPNCGGNGCNFANFYDLKDADKNQTYDVPADDATPATINPTQMDEITVRVEVEGSSDAMVLPGGVGHLAHPTVVKDSREMFFSASEGGYTIVICKKGCLVEGNEISSKQVVLVIGQKTDGRTPDDLNWTFTITEAEQEDVAIMMLYKLDTDPKPYLKDMAAYLLGDDVNDFDIIKVKYSPTLGEFAWSLVKAISDFMSN